MKKTIPFFILLLLAVAFVAAVPSPEPITGQIKLPGYPEPEGLNVVHTNLRTGISYEAVVDASGFYLVDWGNLPHLYGDKVEVAIKLCKEKAECKRVVELLGEPQTGIDIIVPSFAEEAVVAEVKYKYVCADGSIKDGASACLPVAVKEIIVSRKVLVCADGKEVIDASDCPQDYWVLVSVVIGLVAAGLLALYLKDKKKYRWAPGLAGILKYKLAKAKKLKEEGKEAQALKELQSAEKAANTVLKKYLTEESKK